MYKPNELKDLSDHFYHWGKWLSQIQDRKNSHVYKHTDKRAPQILNWKSIIKVARSST